MILGNKLFLDVLDLLREASLAEWPVLCRLCRRACELHEDRSGAALFAHMAGFTEAEIAESKRRIMAGEAVEHAEPGGAESGL